MVVGVMLTCQSDGFNAADEREREKERERERERENGPILLCEQRSHDLLLLPRPPLCHRELKWVWWV